ncbi:ImmA/IrrE family metallo-endopeptidase [Ramlibacter henchirensis]|uniref:ImmA/IrrE family metallo-endopeptidase n=1 Tax=Ramlibacter henchirensis TaxID=204072 RepID=A0A4Z0BUK1_9BURK|nr:ImmA/IrrE family metallo-endopeptidase [Ramlibacter henchirensis]TFZ02986.1 ImmA/IrrE family metallo-endopeptidase [Ramlibacter henchirensis]
MTLAAKTLYETVAQLGLTRAQVRKLLPHWWDPVLEKSADGVAELAVHLSRRLSVELQALTEGRLVPKGAVSRLAYKHSSNLPESSLASASFIASSLAQAVLGSMEQPYRQLPQDTAELRRLARSVQSGLLSFDGLLEMCWSHGIPVIPLPHLPVGVRKMDGAALQVGDRPVIVVAKKKSSRAWLSFILAHEIGHIVRGHLKAGSSIVDISLQETTEYLAESSSDPQETEADEFALQLLGGKEVELEVATWPSNASPVELAVKGREAAARFRIEAGHFVLRNAFLSKRWPEAMMALRFLSEDVNPEATLIGHLQAHLRMDLIAEDLQELVARITGWAAVQQR